VPRLLQYIFTQRNLQSRLLKWAASPAAWQIWTSQRNANTAETMK
jgi:Signal transduction histidine kinase